MGVDSKKAAEADGKPEANKKGATTTDAGAAAAAAPAPKPVPAKVALLEGGGNALAKHNARIRKGVSTPILTSVINEFLSSDQKLHAKLTAAVDVGQMLDADDEAVVALPAPTPRSTLPIPEVETYIHLVVAMFVFDHGELPRALECISDLITRVSSLNRRSLDRLAARAYQLWALVLERSGKVHEVRSHLIAAHRSACLRHDEPGQAVLTNLIIRNYLLSNLYAQADKFRLNCTFPEARSNYQTARYLYYVGKINSVQLHYSDAFANLSAALRKAPTKAAVGFRQAATKLLVVIQLLMGDIPERSLFFEPTLVRSLRPYFQLTQAVRIGDLNAFTTAQSTHAKVFERDGVLNLITRLRFNVIKIGLRKISLSYSRISIAEIASKLSLNSVEDAEYIIAKAIKDGVIDALIDRKKGFVYSTDNDDVYSTNEPQAQFHRRIEFCLDLYNSAVMSMRYHNAPGDKDHEGDERAAEHDQILEVLEEELKDEDLDDFMGDHD
ncbi:hypothetical protein PBRA_004502 [Plasmodiophora brassicae]|uniref:PCI domain-containing protein n=1 Tax=Plasmodiophora brassicae TaxID=37360 RepID=A0A0G4IKV3_PLABS|nr:hypothetical protein PBRA_004502 [Plasmodiophora brassicae]